MGRRRTGVSDKVTGDVVRRFVDVRALWLAVHNDPNLAIEEVGAEFYYAVGELLEGKSMEQVKMYKIDRARVLRHVREG